MNLNVNYKYLIMNSVVDSVVAIVEAALLMNHFHSLFHHVFSKSNH